MTENYIGFIIRNTTVLIDKPTFNNGHIKFKKILLYFVYFPRNTGPGRVGPGRLIVLNDSASPKMV